jgi:hypothetical protein
MDPRYYTVLNDDLRTKLDDANSAIEDSSERIIELDGQKSAYDDIIISLDNDILNEVNDVNNKIITVSDAYQDRINVGCRTDVFWRRVGLAGTIHTLVATKLSLAGYAGTLPNVQYFNGVGFTTYSNYDTFGYTEENAYGIKYYDEPVTQDIGDTFVTSFIGTISPGENKLTVLSVVGSSSTIGITTGQLVISSKDGVIPTSSNIIGIGTTALSQSVLGISTGSVVSILTLDTTATGIASAPESDGSYVTFTVLTSTTEFGFDDYEIQSDKDPYSPQTIGIMTSGNIAIGVSVVYDNSGNEPNVVSWNPNYLNEEEVTTLEPEVGAGVYYLPVGFTSYPVSLSGQRIAVGFATTVTDAQLTSILTVAASCPTQETNLTSAINTLNTAKSDISSGISTLNYKIDVANTFRDQRKEIQSEIWGLSQQIASYRADIITYDKALNYLGVSTVTDIVL